MKSLLTAFIMYVAMTILTGILYPLIVTSTAKLLWSKKANGSLIKLNDVVIGSKLLAQSFVNEKYFWPRPSAGNFATLPSQASNFGPTNKTLKEQIEKRQIEYALVHNVDDSEEINIENITTSASGLDPHILEKDALLQLGRIVKARHLQKSDEERARKFISEHAEKIGFSGGEDDKIVNVLLLNLHFDREFIDDEP